VVAALEARLDAPEILIAGLHAEGGVPLDVTNAEAVATAVADFKPTHFIHLAAISHQVTSANDPNLAWRVNVMGTLNCARAVLKHAPDASFVFASSAQVYGATAEVVERLKEGDPLSPTSEYGATKAAADVALGAMATQGLRTVRLRLFNHTGPGQPAEFVVPSFAMQIARIERGEQAPRIAVGNLAVARDMLDVRDVAKAYAVVVERSDAIAPGTILNIATGAPVKIGVVLDKLIALSGHTIEIVVDPSRQRGGDIAVISGDPARACEVLGWKPRISLEQTLGDLLDDCRGRVTGSSR
jgi:GDP-4-dehydro-6-deoxy-D-mannose reductase